MKILNKCKISSNFYQISKNYMLMPIQKCFIGSKKSVETPCRAVVSSLIKKPLDTSKQIILKSNNNYNVNLPKNVQQLNLFCLSNNTENNSSIFPNFNIDWLNNDAAITVATLSADNCKLFKAQWIIDTQIEQVILNPNLSVSEKRLIVEQLVNSKSKLILKSQNSATLDNRSKGVNLINDDGRPGIIDLLKEIKPSSLIDLVNFWLS